MACITQTCSCMYAHKPLQQCWLAQPPHHSSVPTNFSAWPPNPQSMYTRNVHVCTCIRTCTTTLVCTCIYIHVHVHVAIDCSCVQTQIQSTSTHCAQIQSTSTHCAQIQSTLTVYLVTGGLCVHGHTCFCCSSSFLSKSLCCLSILNSSSCSSASARCAAICFCT